jgi:myo-inositol-hexaphosphate 3-phosphohydrolase
MILFAFLIPLFASLFAMTDVPRPVATTMPGKNVDSPAVWIAPKPEDSLVLLTEKGGGQVMVFKADARATFVRRFGRFKRPNGVAILQNAAIGSVNKDLAFVTDRDGNVIHVYSIPEFDLVGSFAEKLKQPMGISLHRRKSDYAVFAFVVRKLGNGDDKVVRYRIGERNGRITGTREINFGRELSTNQETIFVDPDRELVYVADENRQDVKVYDLDGKLVTTFGKGHFSAQVEGIALTGCGRSGFIIASDQKDVTELEVFDRATFEHLATIKTSLRVTDGIALTETPLPEFPGGLFVAHSDPDGSGGRHAEFYHLDQLLAAAGLNLAEKSGACRN